MKAVTVEPGVRGSLRLEERAAPTGGGLLVETWAVGVCGTDMEIVDGGHAEPPADRPSLVIGHESLGRVVDAPEGSGFTAGDLVVGIVRRPDPVPCACCARGDWDMCRNGGYTERGIKGLDGFASELFATEPEFAVQAPSALGLHAVLAEPASVVAKAWRRVDDAAGINCVELRTALVTGAGPIGLLAALLARQRGLEVHVLDRAETGPKPELVAGLGATYHRDLSECPPVDVVVECTGAPALVFDVFTRTPPNAVVCLTGVSEHSDLTVDGGAINREIVLENHVVIGSVNANRRDYETGLQGLERADPAWLDALIRRRVPLARWSEAYERRADDVKTILSFRD